MNTTHRLSPLRLLLFAACLLLLGGCASLFPPKPADQFAAEIDRLVVQAVSQADRSSAVRAPAVVLPGSLRDRAELTRLEELVVERLGRKLRSERDLYTFSRQNWFEFREERPLSFSGQGAARQEELRQLVVFEVKVTTEEILKQTRVQIVASDAEGKVIPGVMAEATFEHKEKDLWRELYVAKAQSSPFPEGLEERPYASLDRLAFSLASELADAYRSGAAAGDQRASDEEVQVLLYAKNPTGQTLSIQNALQQAIVGQRGFTCAVSQEDLGAAFRQIDAYRRNSSLFELEETRFAPGTVLMMLETVPKGDQLGVALRSLWRVSPLESEAGGLIPTSVAGTYLSGLTAKAYVAAKGVGSTAPTTPVRSEPTAGQRSSYQPGNQHGFE